MADAVHIAIYYVGSVLLDYTSQAVDNRQYRPSARSSPQSNPRDSFGAMPPPRTRDEAAYFARGQEGYGSMPPGRTGGPPSTSRPHGQVWSSTGNMPNAQVQQLFIPEQYVSAIIGPKGRSINEIRASSATTIKIMEPSEQAASDVRGQPGERASLSNQVDGHPHTDCTLRTARHYHWPAQQLADGCSDAACAFGRSQPDLARIVVLVTRRSAVRAGHGKEWICTLWHSIGRTMKLQHVVDRMAEANFAPLQHTAAEKAPKFRT